jgi:hypothetical protein
MKFDRSIESRQASVGTLKIGSVTATLHVDRKSICNLTFRIYCPIWVEICIRDRHKLLLRDVLFRGYRQGERVTSLVGVNKITFTCVP